MIIRSDRRTLSLHINDEGELIIKAPKYLPQFMIDRFIKEKQSWITQKQADAIKRKSEKKQFINGETFLYLGQDIQLYILADQKKSLLFNGSKNQFWLAEKKLDQAKVVFEKWYKDRAKEIIYDRVCIYAEKFGFNFNKFTITSAKTRWGSCSMAGSVCFTWRLIMAPIEVIDYVVVHELVHLKIKNHSRLFWHAVEKLYPSYKAHRAWLRTNGDTLFLL